MSCAEETFPDRFIIDGACHRMKILRQAFFFALVRAKRNRHKENEVRTLFGVLTSFFLSFVAVRPAMPVEGVYMVRPSIWLWFNMKSRSFWRTGLMFCFK